MQEKTIEEVMLQIFKALPKELTPDGTNEHFGYSYISIQQIKKVIGKELKKNGVLFKFNVLEVNNDFIVKEQSATNVLTTIKVEGHFMLGRDGGDYVIYSYGQGIDNQGKGLSKAKSDALKRLFTDNLLIATADEDEEKASEKKQNNVSGKSSSKSKLFPKETKKNQSVSDIIIRDPSAPCTTSQMGAIFAIFKKQGYNEESIKKEIETKYHKRISELTKGEASDIINEIQ